MANHCCRAGRLGQLDDGQIIELATQYKADYVVLPHNELRSLTKVYDNQVWAVFQPKVAVAATSPGSDSQARQEAFVQQVALPNIEKNRKSDAWVQIADGSVSRSPGAVPDHADTKCVRGRMLAAVLPSCRRSIFTGTTVRPW